MGMCGQTRAKYRLYGDFLILCSVILTLLLCPSTSSWAQNFSKPIERQLDTEYLAPKSGFLVANARTDDCLKNGKPNQRLQVIIDGTVVATEESSGPQQAVSITYPVPKNSAYRITTSCLSAYATAFFIESERRADLFTTSEKLPFNSPLNFPQNGIVIATTATGRCQSDSPPEASQRLSYRNVTMDEKQFLEERDVGESHTLSITAPLLASTSSVIEVECADDSIQKNFSFFPFSGSTGTIKPGIPLQVGREFTPPTDGLLVLSARSGACISNNQILQRVSIIVGGATIADEQSYGVNRSLSVTSPVQKGARVIPEAACPLAEASALFYPIDVLAPVIIPECLDKRDNDSDGLIDSSDPGCRSITTSMERDGTTECQDGMDNDSDGSIDYPSEFSCSSPQDNDENDIASQCQDGIDNDNDGTLDETDKGCATNQDNQENDELIECNDGIDNDKDGAIDLLDAGCDSIQDRSEFNEVSKVRIYPECIQSNGDATFTAYITYENTVASPVQFDTNLPSSVLQYTHPDTLLPGIHRGAIRVVFSGDNMVLKITAKGSGTNTLGMMNVELSSSLKKCASVLPSAECIDSSNGELLGTFGYSNQNSFDIELPVGSNNLLLGVNSGALPITRFKPGRNVAAFSAPFKERAFWVVQGLPVELSSQSPTCAGGCIGTSTITIRSEVNSAAIQLAQVTIEATQFMKSQVRNLTSRSKKQILKADIRRASTRAQSFLKEANSLMVQIPTIIKSCPNAAEVCTKVSHYEVVQQMKRLLLQQEAATKRFISRTLFALNQKDVRRNPLVIKAARIAKEGIASLLTMPLDVSTCG